VMTINPPTKQNLLPVYKEACRALPPRPKRTEYRATLLRRLAKARAASCWAIFDYFSRRLQTDVCLNRGEQSKDASTGF
jgi:hypothetical protein